MSLTATVYCDCVEKQRLRIQHPVPELLFIDDAGYPQIRSSDPHYEDLHDQWEAQNPCSHEHFRLVDHWLGNVASIGKIRQKLEELSENASMKYPIVTSKVIYNGSHSGDFLAHDEVVHLRNELTHLRKLNAGLKTAHWDDFLSKLEELVSASLRIGKPIAF